MTTDIAIFVVDTGPLITLAAADSLDYLLYVNTPLVIPDAVLYEATFDANRLGARSIVDWVKAHRAQVEVAPTTTYEVFDAARSSIPRLRQADLGERAAIEVIEEPDRLRDRERGLLLCEETQVLRRVVVRDKAKIVELSTLDFLRILENERRIQSADDVLRLAELAGRAASRVQKLPDQDVSTRSMIADLVKRRDGHTGS